MHKSLEVPRRNFARARLTISLARSSPTKGVILVFKMMRLFVGPHQEDAREQIQKQEEALQQRRSSKWLVASEAQ